MNGYDYNYSYSYSYGDPTAFSGFMMAYLLFIYCIIFVVALVRIVSMWKIFTKAGEPGWIAIVPIYNTYKLFEIAGKPGWWVVLMLVPGLNIIVDIVLCLELGKAFGKSQAFSIVALWLFSIVGFPMLAFGNSQYTKPVPSENFF